MGERAMRPFWIHQMAEYLIGIALVSQGVQDPQPLMPTVAGAAIVVNAAIVRGPLGAFKTIGRATHKWMDLGVMIAMVLAAVQPWIEVSSTGRLFLLAFVVPLGFLWFYTDWAERQRRTERRVAAAGPKGEQVGKVAGRLAGSAYTSARAAIKKRRKDS